VNITLAIFNLIPAFPMDGGRVFRSILALKMDYVRATSVAVSVGQALAMVLIFFGVFFNWWLTLIGLFLYMGAGSEKQQVVLRSFVHRLPVAETMTIDFRSLRPDEPISRAIEHFYHGCQQDFPVIGPNGIEGVLTRDRILASIHEKGLDVPVCEVMDRDFVSVGPETPLDDVYRKLQSGQKTAVAVVQDRTVKGMVCLDSLSRYFMVRAAMKETGADL
jgi:predicted transcriptional regulator